MLNFELILFHRQSDSLYTRGRCFKRSISISIMTQKFYGFNPFTGYLLFSHFVVHYTQQHHFIIVKIIHVNYQMLLYSLRMWILLFYELLGTLFCSKSMNLHIFIFTVIILIVWLYSAEKYCASMFANSLEYLIS